MWERLGEMVWKIPKRAVVSGNSEFFGQKGFNNGTNNNKGNFSFVFFFIYIISFDPCTVPLTYYPHLQMVNTGSKSINNLTVVFPFVQ